MILLLSLSDSVAIMEIKRRAQLTGHSGPLYTVTPGNKGNTVFTGSGDQFVAEWNLETCEAEKFAVKMEATIYALCNIESLNLLLIGQAKGGIHVVDLAERKEVRFFTHHQQAIYDIQYLPSKNHFYALSGDGSFSVWDATEMQLLRTIPLCDEKLRNIAFSTDGNLAAIACGDGTIRIFDTDLHNELHTIEAHEKGASSVCFHPNGKTLISGGRDAHLRAWDVNNDFKEVLSIPAHNFTIYSIVFSKDGTLCATGSRDKTVKIWSAETFDLIQRLERKGHQGHFNSVNKLYWSDYNDYLVSVSDDRSMIVWEFQNMNDET